MAKKPLLMFALALAGLPFFTACARQQSPIPPGTYTAKTGERIIVTPSKVYLDVHVSGDGLPDRQFTGEFDYAYQDGRIYPRYTTSGTMYALGRYAWKWDGQDITRAGWMGSDRTPVRFNTSNPSKAKPH